MPGDVDDAASLTAAFQGANLIFGNTAFSNAFAMPTAEDLAKLTPGQTLREWCYELELQQGKNIVDAASSVGGLDLFIWSSLSHASKWSGGKYKGVFHFDSKAMVVEYAKEKYPELWKKTSLLQMGLFVTNWKWGQGAVPWEKVSMVAEFWIELMIVASRWIVGSQSPWKRRCTDPIHRSVRWWELRQGAFGGDSWQEPHRLRRSHHLGSVCGFMDEDDWLSGFVREDDCCCT